MDTAAAAASPTTNFDRLTSFPKSQHLSCEIANCDLNFTMSETYSDFNMFE